MKILLVGYPHEVNGQLIKLGCKCTAVDILLICITCLSLYHKTVLLGTFSVLSEKYTKNHKNQDQPPPKKSDHNFLALPKCICNRYTDLLPLVQHLSFSASLLCKNLTTSLGKERGTVKLVLQYQ